MSLPLECSSGSRSAACIALLRVALLASGVVYPLFGDGELRWGGNPYRVGSSSSGPQIVQSLTVDTDGTVYASVSLNTTPTTGSVKAIQGTLEPPSQPKWTFVSSDAAAFQATPMIGPNNTVYVGAMNGTIYAIEKATGREKAEFATTSDFNYGSYISRCAAISKDGATIYMTVSENYAYGTTSTSALYALSADLKVQKWVRRFFGGIESSPAVADDGTIYVTSLNNNVYAINPDGSVRWTYPLDTEIWASPAIGGDGTIYVGSIGRRFVAISPQGHVVWEYQLTTPGAAAIGPDATVYVGNLADAKLYALQYDAVANRVFVKWSQTGWSQVWSAGPTIRADGTVLFGGATDNTLHAYDANSGTIKWSFRAPDSILGAAAISPTPDHSIFVATEGGEIYAIRGNASGLSPYSSWPTVQHDNNRTGVASDKVNQGRLANVSTRGFVTPGNALIAALVVKGRGTKTVLARAIGPTLGSFGVQAALPNPLLAIHATSGDAPGTDVILRVNDDWATTTDPLAPPDVIEATTSAVGAFPLVRGSKDAVAIFQANPALGFSNVVESADGASGTALVEFYDSTPQDSSTTLANLSTRGFVGVGDTALIAGLVIQGSGKQRVLVRGIGGVALANFGVKDVLSQPTITVFDSSSHVIGANAGWTAGGVKGDVAAITARVGAFALTEGSTDSALVLTLDPGAYTIQVSGAGGATGTALVEVYAVSF